MLYRDSGFQLQEHTTQQHNSVVMTPLFTLVGLLGLLTSFASATSLTYKLTPNAKECFFSYVEQQGAKIAFYFAVRIQPIQSIQSIQRHEAYSCLC